MRTRLLRWISDAWARISRAPIPFWNEVEEYGEPKPYREDKP